MFQGSNALIGLCVPVIFKWQLEHSTVSSLSSRALPMRQKARWAQHGQGLTCAWRDCQMANSASAGEIEMEASDVSVGAVASPGSAAEGERESSQMLRVCLFQSCSALALSPLLLCDQPHAQDTFQP
jgi:hypothetical protein